MAATETPRWDNRVILLHWLTMGSVLTAFAAAWLLAWAEDRTLRAALLGAHRTAGLLAFGLTPVRLWLRLRVVAAPRLGLPPLQALAAGLTHAGLYGLLLLHPLLGWAYSSARGHHILLFGTLPVPALPFIERDWQDTLLDAHAVSGNLLLLLIGLHAAAALHHGLFRRDGVAQAMLPQAVALRLPRIRVRQN